MVKAPLIMVQRIMNYPYSSFCELDLCSKLNEQRCSDVAYSHFFSSKCSPRLQVIIFCTLSVQRYFNKANMWRVFPGMRILSKNKLYVISFITCLDYVSVPPCRSICNQVNQKCGTVLAILGQKLDCTVIDPRTNFYRYPETSITYSINGMNFTYPCNLMDSSSSICYV